VDYEEHALMHQYLTEKFSDNRFSAVIDAYGIQELYTPCARYLAPGKPFATVGIAFVKYSFSSILEAVYLMLKNILWPRLLGGVQRDYVNVTGIANLATMENLGLLVEEGKLKVVVDSCWGMEDVLKVPIVYLINVWPFLAVIPLN
jgi:Zinc-binding dehydrogenase